MDLPADTERSPLRSWGKPLRRRIEAARRREPGNQVPDRASEENLASWASLQIERGLLARGLASRLPRRVVWVVWSSLVGR